MTQSSLALQALASAENPRPEIRSGLIALILVAAGLLGWASTARLDAATYAQGFIVVSGERKKVQHPEGGVVSRVLVTEGQSVTRGQPLVEMDGVERLAEARGLIADAIALEVMRARLEAARDGVAIVRAPAWFETLSDTDKPAADAALAAAQAALDAERAARESTKNVLRQRAEQLRAQIVGAEYQAASVERQIDLIDRELIGARSLAAKGLMPRTKVNALERARAELDGQRGALAAAAARAREAIGETELQALSLDAEARAIAEENLMNVGDRITALIPRRAVAQERMERLVLLAPATGRVVGLAVHTQRGVVAAGQTIMEIVPADEPRIVEAMVPPDAAEEIAAGMVVEIRLSGLARRDASVIGGKILDVSPDRLIDERSGQSFFRLRIAVDDAELVQRFGADGGEAMLRPGLPAEVVVPLRERTALQYLIEPLFRALWRGMRED